MASRKHGPRPNGPSQRADRNVKVRRDGPAVGVGLPVNPGFADPNEIDRARGVEPDAAEQGQAERAVAQRTLRELFPKTLRLWIYRQQRRRGGRVGLVDQLIAMKPIPARTKPLPPAALRRGLTAEDVYKASLLRAIERSGPAVKPGRKESHGTLAKADYRERVALLALRESQVVLAVNGKWAFVWEGGRREYYNWMYTDLSDPTELEEARAIVAHEGDGLVDYVLKVNDERIVGSGVLILVMLHGMQIQVDPGR